MIWNARRFIVGLLFSAILLSGCLPQILPEPTSQGTTGNATIQITPTFTVRPTRASIPTVTPVPKDQNFNKPFPTATSPANNTHSMLTVNITPAASNMPTPSSDDAPCYQATFLKSVTIADGTGFQPGLPLLKVWQVQNSGSCEWSPKTALVFAHGIDFNAPPMLPLDTSVPPGAILDLTLNFKTPKQSGTYQGFWKLQNEMGVPIEMLNAPDSQIALKIVVFIPEAPEPGLTFDFTTNFCSAEWSSHEGLLTCPSKELVSEEPGVIRSYTPRLENNSVDNEPALVLQPSSGEFGYISALYPEYTVQEGDRFKTVVGCMRQMPKCRVTFELNYTEDGEAVRNLYTWEEFFDGKLKKVDISLDAIKGKTVQFVLTVTNSGDSFDDQAFWLWPRISNPNTTK